MPNETGGGKGSKSLIKMIVFKSWLRGKQTPVNWTKHWFSKKCIIAGKKIRLKHL